MRHRALWLRPKPTEMALFLTGSNIQMRNSQNVVGMVLVDPTHELRLFTTIEGKAVPIASLTAEQYLAVLPKREVTIPRRQPQMGEPFTRLPGSLYKTRVELDKRLIDSFPVSVSPDVVAQRAEAERATLAELYQARKEAPHPLGNLPLVILTKRRRYKSGTNRRVRRAGKDVYEVAAYGGCRCRS